MERYDKVGICKNFGINQFIDDRLEILSYLFDAGIREDLLLFNPCEREVERYEKYLKDVKKVYGWNEILGCLLK